MTLQSPTGNVSADCQSSQRRPVVALLSSNEVNPLRLTGYLLEVVLTREL